MATATAVPDQRKPERLHFPTVERWSADQCKEALAELEQRRLYADLNEDAEHHYAACVARLGYLLAEADVNLKTLADDCALACTAEEALFMDACTAAENYVEAVDLLLAQRIKTDFVFRQANKQGVASQRPGRLTERGVRRSGGDRYRLIAESLVRLRASW